jgi:hypothetical protein
MSREASASGGSIFSWRLIWAEGARGAGAHGARAPPRHARLRAPRPPPPARLCARAGARAARALPALERLLPACRMRARVDTAHPHQTLAAR